MLAALSLMVISIYYFNKKKNILPIAIPMLFVMIISLLSLFINAQNFLVTGKYGLLTIDLALIVLICWMVAEFFIYIRRKRLYK